MRFKSFFVISKVLRDRTGFTIATRFVPRDSSEHEGNFHQQRRTPIGRDILADNLGSVRARIDFASLMIDDMDVAYFWHTKSGGYRRPLKTAEPVQSSIEFSKSCTFGALAVVVQTVSLHVNSGRGRLNEDQRSVGSGAPATISADERGTCVANHEFPPLANVTNSFCFDSPSLKQRLRGTGSKRSEQS